MIRIEFSEEEKRALDLTGCKFQVPQNLRRLINVYAINFMP
jgi:hypothetical protein